MGAQPKSLKGVNVRQNSAANMGTDAREGLMGPEVNALDPLPPGQRPLQCHKCKSWGHVKRVCPSHLNYMREAMPEEGPLTPPKQESAETQTFNLRRDPIIAKAVKMADRYHNPDPLI